MKNDVCFWAPFRSNKNGTSGEKFEKYLEEFQTIKRNTL